MKILIIILIILGIWIVWSIFADKGLESPKYSVLKKHSSYELRKYDSYIIAETTVSGDLSTSTRGAFMELGGYIFGGNTENESIAMTAPIKTEQQGRNIAMTAPVATEQNDENMSMSFMMPSKFTLENLPKPNSKNVSFKEVESGVFAVSSFTGWVSEKKRLKKNEQLFYALKTDGISTVGQFQLLQYDRPFKFPYLRKNEIKIQVDNYEE
jgi:hypothetical protein